MSKNTLLISVATVKERSVVHENMDDKLVYSHIKTAQDMWIREALGDSLMERLQAGIENEDLTTDENYLIDHYIIDSLVFFTIAEMPLGASYQFFTKGALRRTSDQTELPSLSDMLDISAQYQSKGEYYRERLIKYLKNNKTMFPQYTECQDDINPSSSGYSAPMWLGD